MAVWTASSAGQAPPFDLVITGGQVLDGTGAAAVRADVGIRGDRIAAIGTLAGQAARRTVDAGGLVVAPGFIDLHTHSEMPLLADGTAQSKVRQGVTLDVTGGAPRRRRGITSRRRARTASRPTGARSPRASHASRRRASRSTPSPTSPPSRCGAW
ncbi:MAG: amidohydrolase family protein [Vicinamibacterales bacterium]